jgi:colanic acid biosynthesis glycosyl transferase WcaI
MVRELATDLTRSGHEVTVLTGWPSHPAGTLFPGWKASFRQVEQDEAEFRIIRCRHSLHPRMGIVWRMWYYLSFALTTLWCGLMAGRVDAVLCLSTPIFGSWASWLLARCKGAKFVYDIFDLHPEAARNAGLVREGLAYRVLRWFDSALCRRSDRIATLSEGLKRSIVERGIPPEKITLVPFWIDADRIRPGQRDNAWRTCQGIPPELFVALYAGTIGYVSGAEILAAVAQRLQQRSDVLLVVVGEGPVKDSLQADAAALGLRAIRFLPFQPEEQLNDMMASADVGLVTLLPQTGLTSIPSKILGYLAAGRAVIAAVAEQSDTAQMIRQAECGLVVPPQDPVALANAICRLADDRALLCRLSENARSCLLEQFSRQHCVAAYERLLTDWP